MKKRIVVSIVAVAMVFSQFSFTSGKELLKKNANESEAQTGSERELGSERKLEEEKQALLTEEEGYSSQYLVWHGAESLDTDILAGHAQQVYVKAKAQKAKKEKVVKGKIKDSEAKQEFIDRKSVV